MNYTCTANYYQSETVINNNFSFAPTDYRTININANTKRIKDIADSNLVGEQIDTMYYINQLKTPYKLITIQNMKSILLDSKNGGEYIYQNIFDKSTKKIKKNDLLISRNASLGKISYVNEDTNLILNGGISLLRIKQEIDRFYLIAFFISTYGEEYLKIKTSSGGTQQNAKKEDLLEMEIPFPEQKETQELVSIMVQNIIDKEQKIKFKNEKINQMINEELESHSNITISYPSSKEFINNNFRFDSGLYSNEYKYIKLAIETYEYGYFKLLDRYNAKRGQNLQISNIGLSIYSNKKKDNFYRLVTNVEFTEERTISAFRYLGNKNNLTLIPKSSILLSADGSVGRCIYVDDLGKTITNIHPWIITSKNKEKSYKNIFTAMFLGYLRTVGFYEKIQDKSNGGGIKLPHLQNWISIPNFPEVIQKQIAKEYYNELENNKNLMLDTYLEAEKDRNSRLGIWQLNMELFTLKEELEDIISDIVYSKFT